jgi:hypothetical protein
MVKTVRLPPATLYWEAPQDAAERRRTARAAQRSWKKTSAAMTRSRAPGEVAACSPRLAQGAGSDPLSGKVQAMKEAMPAAALWRRLQNLIREKHRPRAAA